MRRRGKNMLTAVIANHAGAPAALRAVLVPALSLVLGSAGLNAQGSLPDPVSSTHGTRAGPAIESNDGIWRRAGLDLPPLQGDPAADAFGDALAPEAVRNAFRFPDPRVFARGDGEAVRPGAGMLASAVLPGAGQLLQGSDRWVPYLAIEVWAWISFFNRRSDAHDLAADYRDLAWSVARRVSIGNRRDTIFEYYEEMTHYASSGTFDSDPEAIGIQPELDVRTFNGDLWALSRGLFWGGQTYLPGTAPYNQALDYYLDHAIPPTFTWAWGDSFLEQQSFRELIRRSDEAYRTSTQFLGLILANHVVSAVDALVFGRLRSAGGESRFRVGSGFEPTAGRIPRLRIEAAWRW